LEGQSQKNLDLYNEANNAFQKKDEQYKQQLDQYKGLRNVYEDLEKTHKLLARENEKIDKEKVKQQVTISEYINKQKRVEKENKELYLSNVQLN